jgi:hypothetical protein
MSNILQLKFGCPDPELHIWIRNAVATCKDSGSMVPLPSLPSAVVVGTAKRDFLLSVLLLLAGAYK